MDFGGKLVGRCQWISIQLFSILFFQRRCQSDAIQLVIAQTFISIIKKSHTRTKEQYKLACYRDMLRKKTTYSDVGASNELQELFGLYSVSVCMYENVFIYGPYNMVCARCEI